MPTAIIYADKDAFISQNQAGAAASSYQNQNDPNGSLQVYGSFSAVIGATHQPSSGTMESDAVIGFPGSVPAGAIISAATLNVRNKSGTAGGLVEVAHIGDFDEAAVSWTSYNHAHGTIASAAGPSAGNWFVVSVLGYVAAAARTAFLLFSKTQNNSAEKSAWFEMQFYPSESTSAPYLSVTYSSAPGAPGSISTPVAGSTHDALINLFAGAASDPDTPQANLQYEWSYSPDGGTNWTVIAGLTAAGTTAKAWDTSALPPGTNYKVRIRSRDPEGQYGPYTTMAGVFSIIHTSQVKIWNGAAWVLKNLYRWNGAAWVSTKLKRWNGTTWITE